MTVSELPSALKQLSLSFRTHMWLCVYFALLWLCLCELVSHPKVTKGIRFTYRMLLYYKPSSCIAFTWKVVHFSLQMDLWHHEKSCKDRQAGEWRKQMQLCRHTKKKHTHTAVTVNTVQIHWGITNPLIVGQLDYFSCRSHSYPAAIPQYFMLAVWKN